MASIGHIAVGMAAARVYHEGRAPAWWSMAAWSALSLLPDSDVIGFALGVHYGDPWGHRGATHSLTIAIAGGVAIGLAARGLKRPAPRTGIIAAIVLASHGLLDTLTDGGLGAASFWPFDLTRYFAPWRPIPVAPIGLDFFSPQGLFVSLIEVVLFGPLLVFALCSRPLGAKTAAAGLALWLTAVWLFASGDHEESRFYCEGGSTIESGMSDYQPGCRVILVEDGLVSAANEKEPCKARGVEQGSSAAEVSRRLGPPRG